PWPSSPPCSNAWTSQRSSTATCPPTPNWPSPTARSSAQAFHGMRRVAITVGQGVVARVWSLPSTTSSQQTCRGHVRLAGVLRQLRTGFLPGTAVGLADFLQADLGRPVPQTAGHLLGTQPPEAQPRFRRQPYHHPLIVTADVLRHQWQRDFLFHLGTAMDAPQRRLHPR